MGLGAGIMMENWSREKFQHQISSVFLKSCCFCGVTCCTPTRAGTKGNVFLGFMLKGS